MPLLSRLLGLRKFGLLLLLLLLLMMLLLMMLLLMMMMMMMMEEVIPTVAIDLPIISDMSLTDLRVGRRIGRCACY